MKHAFAYYRVSTTEQAEEGKSLTTQANICNKWAMDNGYEIVQEFIDEGKSATNINRPSLQKMLSLIPEKTIQVLIVQDTDRLARNTLDHLQIKTLLKKHNCNLVSVNQPMLDDSPEGNLVDIVIAGMNAFQSQITGRKVSNVMEEKAKFGWYPSYAPYGYKNVDNPKPSCKLDKRIIAVDPDIAPRIKEIFEMYMTGNHTYKSIALIMDRTGFIPPLSTKVNSSYISNVLKNSFYSGVYKWSGKEYDGLHEAIISKEDFYKVQLLINTNNKGVSRSRKHKFLLNGYLYSLPTGALMWSEFRTDKNGKKYGQYFDSKAPKGSYVRSKNLETQVEEIFQCIELSKEYTEYVYDIAQKMLKEAQSTFSSDKKKLMNERNSIEKAMAELEDSRFVTHTISEDAFTRIYPRYEKDLARIDNDLKELQIDYSSGIKRLERLLRKCENIGLAYKEALYEERREYLNMFFSKLWVENGKIVEYELNPDVKTLIEEGAIRVRNTWLPQMDTTRIEEWLREVMFI